MATPQLQLDLKPEEYFHNLVNGAAAQLKVDLEDHVGFYIVNLLCEFIEPARLNETVGQVDLMETPLALILKEALESPPSHRLKLLKRLGDTSLYVAGFFQDYFSGKTFDLDYYITMGANAYTGVSSMMREQHCDQHFTEMYETLAGQFDQLVDVVAEVSDETQNGRTNNILAIYERWMQSQSDRLRRRLEKLGITPIDTRGKAAQ